MKTIYQKLWMLLIAASISLTVSAQNQVTVTSSGGTSTADYSNLASAFGAINAGTHTGVITVAINQSTTEPANTSDTLYSSGHTYSYLGTNYGANYTSIKIYPSATGITVSGSPTTGRSVVELFGADNVTIDGSVGGTGTDRNLTFLATTTNTVTFCGLIRLLNATTNSFLATCSNVTIKNCILTGNVNGTAGNNSTVTSTAVSAWASFGIVVGADSSSLNIPSTKIQRITSVNNSMASVAGSATMDCSADNLVISNNKINQVGRGICFNGNGNDNHASTSVTITDNVIGSDVALSDFTPPVTNATYTNTVYGVGIFITNTDKITVTGNTIHNMATYLTGGVSAIVINGLVNATGPNVIKKNTIANMYYNNATSGAIRGIFINAANGSFLPAGVCTVDSNVISNIQNMSTNSAIGIDLTATSQTVNGTVVSNNVISKIYNRVTTSGLAIGIRLTTSQSTVVANNRISDILYSGGSASFSTSVGAFGIYNNGANNVKIYHNSVYMSGALFTNITASHLTAAFAITANTITGNDVRNNIFINTITGGTTSLAHVAVYLPAAATVPTSMNLTMNNNGYYCGTTTASQGIAQFGTTAGTTYFNGSNFAGFKTLAATFSSAGTNNTGSFANNSGTSPFTSDLHTSPSGASQLESGGATITGVSSIATDIDGDARPNGTAPDMGADEFAGTLLDLIAPSITYSAFSSVCDASSTSSRTVSGVIITDATGVPTSGTLVPRMYYKKGASSTFSFANSAAGSLTSGSATNGSWSFTINYTGLGLANGDSIFYFVTAQDNVGTPNIGTYPVGGVLTDVNTLTTAPSAPFNYRAATLSGTYNVGPGFTGQGFTTLSAAIKAYNNSCLGGPVVFSLISSSYSTTSDSILANPGASATNTLLIKPTQANTVITGNSGAKNGLLVLYGADYVTIDGSIGSTTNSICSPSRASRNLTFTNAYSPSNVSSAVVWLCNTPSGDAATNNKIINCNINGSYNSNFGGFTQVGIGCAGPGTNGSGELVTTNGTNQNWGNANNNNQYINDSISNCGTAVYTAGASASNKNTGTVISQIVTAHSPNNLYRGGISANFEDGITVTSNTINFVNTSTNNFPTAAYGISLGYGPGNTGILTGATSGNEVTNATVSKNVVDSMMMNASGLSNGFGSSIVGILLSTGSTGTSTISNNRISNFANNAGFNNSTDVNSGIHINGGAGTVNVYHNTILATNISGASGGFSTSGSTFGFSLANNAPIVRLRNNIISVNAAGYTNRNTAIGLGYALPASNFTSNNNDLYVSVGTGAAASTVATAIAQTTSLTTSPVYHTSLSAWQTNASQDANSVNVVPVFVSTTDLHLSATGNCSLVGASGLVSDDIDCQSRTSNAMGADEISITTVTPSISISTASTSVCSGSNVSFTAVATNGGSSPNYQWKKNGVDVGSGSTISFLANTLTNNDVITCLLTANNACQTSATATSNAIAMTVKASPSVAQITNGTSTITTASLCTLGAITRYYDATSYGTWTSSNPSVASVTGGSQAGNVTANTNGTATISYNVAAANGCVSTSSVVVTVAAITPNAITGTNSVCVGATTALSCTAPNGTTGVWSSSNNLGTINVSGVYTGANAGTYGEARYTVTDNASGCKAYSSRAITVNAIPSVPTITYAPGTVGNPQAGAPTGGFCIGKKFSVVGVPTGGHWTYTNGAVTTIFDSLVSANNWWGTVKILGAGTGSIKYTYTSASGCSNSRTMSGNGVTCASRGVSMINDQLATTNDFTMYPNPAKGFINLNVETLVGAGSIVVTDLYGKAVKTQALSMGSNTVNTSNLSKGFYLVSVITAEGKNTKKLVVE